MHNVSVAQRTFLSALAALVLLAGALFVAAPKASAAKSDCPANHVCAWEGYNYTGQLSYWAESNTGCHSHAENPKIRSLWNRSGYRVRYGGQGVFEPGAFASQNPGENPITGEICWPA